MNMCRNPFRYVTKVILGWILCVLSLMIATTMIMDMDGSIYFDFISNLRFKILILSTTFCTLMNYHKMLLQEPVIKEERRFQQNVL